jgi:hypothetical protein
MADREGDEVVDPFGGDRREDPRHRGSPVVADHVGAFHAGMFEHRSHIGDQVEDVVGLDPGRLVGAAVAPHVRDDHLEAGVGQGTNLIPPQPPGVGEAVDEHHRPSLSGDLVFDPYPAVVNAHLSSPVSR